MKGNLADSTDVLVRRNLSLLLCTYTRARPHEDTVIGSHLQARNSSHQKPTLIVSWSWYSRFQNFVKILEPRSSSLIFYCFSSSIRLIKATMLELSRCEIDHMVSKVQDTYYFPLHSRSLPSSILDVHSQILINAQQIVLK